jgi:hypothetical protein
MCSTFHCGVYLWNFLFLFFLKDDHLLKTHSYRHYFLFTKQIKETKTWLLMITTYYNSQSVETKTAYRGVKMQNHIFKHENVPIHTWHTPMGVAQTWSDSLMLHIWTHYQGSYVACKANLCLMVCNVLAVRVTHFMIEVLVEVLMTSTLLWDVTPCHQHSGGACYLSAFIVQEEQPYPKMGIYSFIVLCMPGGREALCIYAGLCMVGSRCL